MKVLDDDKIVSLYNENVGVYNIAKQLGVNNCTIYSKLKKLGVYTGKRHRKYLLIIYSCFARLKLIILLQYIFFEKEVIMGYKRPFGILMLKEMLEMNWFIVLLKHN